mmetsp:Transcript_20773/g.43502  ORF Transcript_20773/g.43502 Transcript_20773/m.43502 type:complete len:347 (-) Transcript_20773:52-1092(-)
MCDTVVVGVECASIMIGNGIVVYRAFSVWHCCCCYYYSRCGRVRSDRIKSNHELWLSGRGIEPEVHAVVLGHGVHLGDHVGAGGGLFRTIVGGLGVAGRLLEVLDELVPDGVGGRGPAGLSGELGDRGRQGRLLEILAGGKLGGDGLGGVRHHGELSLFVGVRFLGGDHGQHLFHLCLEQVLGLNLAALVELCVGGFGEIVDPLVVLDDVLRELHVFDGFFELGNDGFFCLVLCLEHVLGFVLEHVGDHVTALCVGNNAEPEEGRREEGLGVRVEPLEFEDGNRAGNSDGNGVEGINARRPSGFDGSLLLFFVFAGCRVVERRGEWGGPRASTLGSPRQTRLGQFG